jgi:hypothetical protein
MPTTITREEELHAGNRHELHDANHPPTPPTQEEHR